MSPLTTPFSPEASAEEILDNIRRLVSVEDVSVGYDRTQPGSGGWRVMVTFRPEQGKEPVAASVPGGTLREAALQAYGACGEDVTHFDTEQGTAATATARVDLAPGSATVRR